MSMNKRSIGSYYEDKAVEYLVKQGYSILCRNYHAGRGAELDIVASKDGYVIGIECKYRSDDSFGDPLEAVDNQKQRRISRAMLHYYAHNGYGMDTPCRFDVIAIYGDGTIKHIENAFDYQA